MSGRQEAAVAQLQQIANNTKLQLALLDQKFSAPDRFKSACGIIAIVAMSVLIGSVFVNDFIRLCIYMISKKENVIKEERFKIKE